MTIWPLVVVPEEAEGRDHDQSPPPHPWIVATAATLAIVTAGAFTTLAGLLVGPLHEEFAW